MVDTTKMCTTRNQTVNKTKLLQTTQKKEHEVKKNYRLEILRIKYELLRKIK